MNDRRDDIIHLRGRFEADIDKLNDVYDYFVDTLTKVIELERLKKYYVVIDELYSNIVKYAYKDIKDDTEKYIDIDLTINLSRKKITVIFEDNGNQFNPLSVSEPDINKSADDREIGGLGILIVKRMMDNIKYEYKDNKNRFIIEKQYN